MRKWIVRAAQAVLIGAAFTAAGAGIANADSTSGDRSILGGNQIQAPITVPVTVSNVPINVLGRQVVSEGEGQGTAAHFSYHYRSTELGGAGTTASCSACGATVPSTTCSACSTTSTPTCTATAACTAPSCTTTPTCTAPSCSCAPSTAMAARLSGVSRVTRDVTSITR